MNKITITIETLNSAFEPDPCIEVERILNDISGKITADLINMSIHDINGNIAGNVIVE